MRWIADLGLVWELVGIIVFLTMAPIGIGLWLDRHAHTTPLGTLAGGILGIVALVWYVRYRWKSWTQSTSPQRHDSHKDV